MNSRCICRLLAITLLLSGSMTVPIYAGSPQFVWKPVSESDHMLAVLFPSKYRLEDVESITVVTADGKVEKAHKTFQTGVNGDRIHARFRSPGSAYGDKPRAIINFSDGTAREWQIPHHGKDRHDPIDPGKAIDGNGSRGSLDDALNEADKDEGSVDTSEGKGTRTFVLERDATVTVSAMLETYGPAELKVTVNGDLWMEWQRQDDKDPSPLSVDGEEIPESMSEVKPGDFSPSSVSFKYEGQSGDRIELLLEGEFGAGNPHLRLKTDPEDAGKME